MQMPSTSRIEATSCGWALSIVKASTPAFFLTSFGPYVVTPLLPPILSSAYFVISLRDLLDRVDRPEDVGTQGHGHDLRPLCEELVVLLHLERPIVAHVDVLQDGPFVVLDEMPGNMVRVVLHDRAEDFVSLLELPLQSVSVRDQVEGFRGGFREHDLVGGLRPDERGDLLPRPL